jgi:hypothetical protein
MLSSAYLSRKLTSPIPTKDGGTLRTIEEACKYIAAIGKERELRSHWQRVRELMLQEADVAAVSHRVRLAVLKDAKVDVTALSEPIERWMGEPPGLVSNGKLKLVEKDEPPTKPIESNERFDSDSKEERRRQEELQRAEARQAAEEKRRRQEELQQAEARQAAEEDRRRQEELRQAEARQAAEEDRRRQEAENKPFWNRFLAMVRARDS